MDQESDDSFDSHGPESIPYKVVDSRRERKKGIVASTFAEFVLRAREKLGVSLEIPIKIVLEQDGTEVDDEEYFGTLERNTVLMMLIGSERWLPPGKSGSRYEIYVDETDSAGGTQPRRLENLVDRLHNDLSHISLLGAEELELLSDMDPDSLTDIIADKIFLRDLRDASGRFLSEKRQAQEAMDLLKFYSNNPQEAPIDMKRERV